MIHKLKEFRCVFLKKHIWILSAYVSLFIHLLFFTKATAARKWLPKTLFIFLNPAKRRLLHFAGCGVITQKIPWYSMRFFVSGFLIFFLILPGLFSNCSCIQACENFIHFFLIFFLLFPIIFYLFSILINIY